ncbi:MAG: dihydropteridine reductase [Clostridia bacterium]|nr:dihydropteridine reductase [Clostridia bacterium]
MNTDKIYAEQIANEYSPKKTSKVVALKKLDQKAKKPAQIFTYTFGIVFALVLGTGMSLCMGVIGEGSVLSMVIGVIVGVVGIVGCGLNYPIYKVILEKGKEKYGSDIIRLAKEITEEE